MTDKVHVYMCSLIASIESTAGNKTRLFPSPFLISTSLFLILTEGFRNDHVAACSTALRNATENNEMGGYVTVVKPICLDSSGVTKLVATDHILNKYSLLKSRSELLAVRDIENL